MTLIRNRFEAARLLIAAGCTLLTVLSAYARAPQPGAGESIYLHGILPSGALLEGKRQAVGLTVRGADAACVSCHQRSGLGTYEGYNFEVTIPPIAGAYLFHSREAHTKEAVLPYVAWMHSNRDPYTDATLARAIREGLDSQGRPLNALMPRFALSDADMDSLIEYLKQLGSHPAPGVSERELHFATVITPDADPARRKAMLDVMEAYFADKNLFPIGNSPQLSTSGKTQQAKSMFMSHRLWRLKVWDLTGPASTWGAQLDADMNREPVFALVAGLGGSNWAPVQRFCERRQLPCLFPNVDAPVDDSRDFYTLYFSKGVLLEAELVARQIAGARQAAAPAPSVLQVYRLGDDGEAAALALAAALKSLGIAVRNQPLSRGPGGDGVAQAVRQAQKSDTLVLWLRPADLAAMGDGAGAPASVYLSGLMGGLEHAPLPPGWRGRARMTYPYELPDKRALRVRYALSWFSIRHIPVVDEPLQVNTYIACGLLAETLSHMADNLVQPFMVEMLQTSAERRLINTGYYPHLVLALNQHFASKGGYIVHFAGPEGAQLVADSDWVVP
ncbi:MAG: cytochrome c [Gammaproteobacteria bacterium]|nr:cytochrome c [Gammaproteobacteria bacterium]